MGTTTGAPVASAPAMMNITWLGHSCFMLEADGFRALLDPYNEVPGLPAIEAEANAVYCSHDHFDHAYTEKVRLTSGKENPFSVTEIQTFHDDKGGTLRGNNVIRKFTVSRAIFIMVVKVVCRWAASSSSPVTRLSEMEKMARPRYNIIRIGSAGAISPKLKLRDVIAAQGACTNSNFAHQYGLPGPFAPL